MNTLNVYTVVYTGGKELEFVYWDNGYPQFSTYAGSMDIHTNKESAIKFLERVKSFSETYLRNRTNRSKYKVVRLYYDDI